MKLATTISVALAVLVPGHTEAAVMQRARYLMGTVCEVAVQDGGNADIERAFAEAARIESMLSTWRDDSELARVNRGETEPSPELRALLDTTLAWSQRTGGAFEPRIRHLVDQWQLRGPNAPREKNEHAFEEGAFGKGYAIDRMLATLGDRDAMIDFGGQIAVRGELRVAIADPTNRQKPVVELTLTDASLSTSSGSEKTFERDGVVYSHILDPRTGTPLPPRGSASAIADDALTADILSTALYVMGEDDGLRWADAHGVAAIFINSHRTVRLSKKARERARGLTLVDRNYSLKD